MTIVDKGRGSDKRECSSIVTETADNSEGIFDTHGDASEELMKSANRDPRQRKIEDISKQTLRERCVNGPPEIVAVEQFSMMPQSDYSMFDFNELERRSPSTVQDEHHDVHRPVHEREYRGEDALEGF